MEFYRFSSRGGPTTPVAHFNDLLRILTMIPGPQGDALRKAQAELAGACARTQAPISAHDLEADRDDSGACVPKKVDSANPVLRNPLMQLTVADFQNCRITPNGLISVFDAILHFRYL